MDEFPEFSTDELVHWLQAKYRRHGEIEDGVAAERLKSLTAEVSDLEFDKAHLLCAMNSIAMSTCCDKCNEAKMVAVKCIEDLATVSGSQYPHDCNREDRCDICHPEDTVDSRQQFTLGIDLAKPGSDTTGYRCNWCKAILFSAEEAEQHECPSADQRQSRPCPRCKKTFPTEAEKSAHYMKCDFIEKGQDHG